jgi:2'-5' RNA ligase
MNPLLWQLPARVPVRLFFAIRPLPDVAPAIENLGEKLARAHRLKGQRIARERLHSTLLPVVGRPPLEDIMARAKRAGARVRSPRFAVSWEWSQSFDCGAGRHPLVLAGGEGLAKLTAFQKRLRAAMAEEGFAVPSGFTPHVTLLWADRAVEENPIAPIQWEVTEFVLTLSPQGLSHHIHVDRWPLQ